MSSPARAIASGPAAGASAQTGRRAGSLVHAYPYTAVVLFLGLLARAVLVPITHGQDFVVWTLASRATLAGSNVYVHHPHYPGGPFAYFPLFLYAELPFQWLSLHTGISFTILGKLPIMAGDLLAAVVIAAILARRGRSDAVVALGTALYFLNPLVLYNGAFYGRFDAFCVGLFLLALSFYRYRTPARRSWTFPLLYAIAVAAKTYPVFIWPWLLVRDSARRMQTIAALVVVVGGISLPYLLTGPRQFFRDIVLYNGSKLPGNLSWQVTLINVLSPQGARLFSIALLALFPIALFLAIRLDLLTYCTVAMLLFLILSKVMIEQYFLWPMPFLILDALERRSRASLALLILTSAVGMLVNPYIHPFGQRPWVLSTFVAGCMLAYILTRRPQRDSVFPTAEAAA